jgi:hypothetical protein
MGGGYSHDANIEPKSDGALNIHVDALVIAYLQMGEISIGLKPKEQDQIVHKAKWFKWPWVLFQHVMPMAMENLGPTP